MNRTWPCVLIAAVLAAGVWRAPVASESRVPPKRVFGWRGTASCASTACHGSTGPADDYRCSYSTWMSPKDKHHRAYEVLLTDRSRLIEKNYHHIDDTECPRPELDRLCLRCHSMDAEAVLRRETIASSDGIGCERCHGAAEMWLSRHYRRDWPTLSSEEREGLGFRPTKDLKARAMLCVECHVGCGETQVNHDLIAAGHPHLTFELSSFVAMMPPHWNVRAEKARHPDLEARLWAEGQLATAWAELELLSFRAEEKNGQPWPEFAEYSCHLCHQDVRVGGARSIRGTGLVWSEWSTALFRPAERPSLLAGPDLGKMFTALGAEMSRPLPDRPRVAREARTTAEALMKRLNDLDRSPTFDAATVQRQFDDLWKERRKFEGDWDSAAPCYLALAALYNGLTDLDPERRDAAVRERLKAMAKEVRSPADFYRRHP